MACIGDSPVPLNMSCYQGATFDQTLTWQTGNPLAPVNLTGYTGRMIIKSSEGVVAELTTENGITLGGALGTVRLFISDTGAFIPATCNYDLFLTSPAGIVTALVAGVFTIQKRVTA